VWKWSQKSVRYIRKSEGKYGGFMEKLNFESGVEKKKSGA